MNFHDHLWCMSLALEEAEKAFSLDEVPVGAVVVGPFKEVLAKSHNQKEQSHNPCVHVEIFALTEAAKKNKNWRLVDCSVYVTLSPCPMCLAAMVQARIGNLYFGAYDLKGGAIELGYHNFKDKKLNHQFNVMGGISQYKCSKLLSNFFKLKRDNYKLNQGG